MLHLCFFFFFFNDTATTEIYTLSLHDALPIYKQEFDQFMREYSENQLTARINNVIINNAAKRSEEHTSELQSLTNLVCRLLLEKKKNKSRKQHNNPKTVNTLPNTTCRTHTLGQ